MFLLLQLVTPKVLRTKLNGIMNLAGLQLSTSALILILRFQSHSTWSLIMRCTVICFARTEQLGRHDFGVGIRPDPFLFAKVAGPPH